MSQKEKNYKIAKRYMLPVELIQIKQLRRLKIHLFRFIAGR